MKSSLIRALVLSALVACPSVVQARELTIFFGHIAKLIPGALLTAATGKEAFDAVKQALTQDKKPKSKNGSASENRTNTCIAAAGLTWMALNFYNSPILSLKKNDNKSLIVFKWDQKK